MAAAKKCAACRRRPIKSATATFCADVGCERERARGRSRKSRQQNPKTPPPPIDVDEDRPAGGVFAATLTELEKAGRVQTSAGQNALALATRIDHGATDSGSSIAALSKQHLATLDQALKDIDTTGDPVDELQARRAARGA